MEVTIDWEKGKNVTMDAVALINWKRTNKEVEVKIYNGDMRNVYVGNERVRKDYMTLRTFSPLASALEIVDYVETLRDILRGDLKKEDAGWRLFISLTIEGAIGNEDEPDGTDEIFVPVYTADDYWKYESEGGEAIIGSLTR